MKLAYFHPRSMTMTSDKIRLDQIIKRFDVQMGIKDALERKATSVIQVAGTMATIIFGFVTFSQSTANLIFPDYLQLTIGIGISVLIGSIITSLLAIRTKAYSVPVNVKEYFDQDAYGRIIKNNGVRKLNSSKISETVTEKGLFEDYLNILLDNEGANNEKAALVFGAVLFLLISVGAITISVFMIFSL